MLHRSTILPNIIKYKLLVIILNVYKSTENVIAQKGVFSIIRLFYNKTFFSGMPIYFLHRLYLNFNACPGVLLTEVNFV